MPLKPSKIPGSPNFYIRGTSAKLKSTRPQALRTRKQPNRSAPSANGKSCKVVFLDQATTTSLIKAAVIYLENGGEARFVKPITDHFGDTAISKIDQDAADKAARTIYPNLAPATLVRQLYTPLTAMINAAATAGLCSPIKFKRPKYAQRPRALDHARRGASIDRGDAGSPKAACGLPTIHWRPHGRSALDRLAVCRFAAGASAVSDTKNGTDRGVPLHPHLVTILANLPHREGVFRKPGRWVVPGHSAKGQLLASRTFLDQENDLDARPARGSKRDSAPVQPRQDHRFLAARLPAHLGDVALSAKPRPANVDGPRRMVEPHMVLRYAHVNVEHRAPSITAMPAIGAEAKAPRKAPSKPRKAGAAQAVAR